MIYKCICFLVQSPKWAPVITAALVWKKPESMSQLAINSTFSFYFLVTKGKYNFTVEGLGCTLLLQSSVLTS